ncbi:CBS domain-containing protein [Streptomyces varsoviensis]|uniref:CBS domain-containing protein n=1 Tax=Streptomyces varsoviensis TaxID=67373 RepID=A0ABR5J1Y9_9ACTN|nr:CBS domain-containing protein [Streptomyces varsoviensis]KOG87452.1 CBS domain-containing protein [Streptomyces varsoviensis]
MPVTQPEGPEEHGLHTVSDVMTHTVVAVGQDAPFKTIVQTMEQWKVSALPVLEGAGRVVGVVSEADLLPKEEFRGSDPSLFEHRRRLEDLAKAGALTARELMTAPAICVPTDATLPQAARIMAVRRVKHLPVTDAEGLLQGMVSRGDLLKVFLRTDADIAEETRRVVIDRVFPEQNVDVTVKDGVVTLAGHIRSTSFVPVAARLCRAVEGVVDVVCEVSGHDGSVPGSARP